MPRGLLFGVPAFEPEAPLAPPPPSDDKATAQLKALVELMEGGFYRREKLTIARLASELGQPEYVVRTLINTRLGFRNFNDFLNQWRVDEATRQLVAEPDKPIMNIALDLGYHTLSSFNRAFKERLNQTPTQYRQQHQ